MVEVKFTCNPSLPENEMVTISHTGPGELYEVLASGEYSLVASGNYRAYDVSNRTFKLHGHAASTSLTNGAITIEHANSGAKDLAKYTDVKLRVTNIKFNHDHSASAEDAINIRRSYKEPIDVTNGEWIDTGSSVTNEPFCYTTNHTVTVKARIEASDFITSAVVRASCSGAKGSLSDVLETNVVFVGGVSSPEYVTFALKDKTLSAIDCSRGGVLKWSATKINGGTSSCEMNDSGPHIVYTIFNEPKPPWNNAYGSEQNAWTNALEFAIIKANSAGKTTDKDAFAALTTYLHSGHGLVYDTVEGASRYWNTTACVFSATAYISVTNGVSVTNLVNCYDQAYGVVTFGNLLGPSVAATPRFTMPFGYINKTMLVGVGDCNNPFYCTGQSLYVNIVGNSYYPAIGVPQKKIICGSDDKTRTWFYTHMYVTFDSTGTNYVFDACAGPCVGNITLPDYLKATIDQSTKEERALGYFTQLHMPNNIFPDGAIDEKKNINFTLK